MKLSPVPLRLFLLAHPQSESANLLAQELMRRFVDPPATGGLRLPVFFTPDQGTGRPPAWDGPFGINLDESDHTLVVVLSDSRMALEVTFGDSTQRATGPAWREFLADGARRAPVGASPHHVFAVAIANKRDPADTVAAPVFSLSGDRHALGVTREPDPVAGESAESFGTRQKEWVQSTADEISLHIAIRALRLLLGKEAVTDHQDETRAPVRLFLSHAKADLKSGERDVVRSVEEVIQELPIEPWFDAAKIRPGENFASEIRAGIKDCTIVVAFLTDNYASRPFCQREVLDAKQLGAPILVVDALEVGEPRNFPYLGNVPTIRWHEPRAISGSSQSGQSAESLAQQRESFRKRQALRIVGRAVREALRYRHNRQVLERWKEEGEIVVAAAPEALLVSHHRNTKGSFRVLYPDPPLSQEERNVLTDLRSEPLELVTPLTKLAHWGLAQKPANLKCLAVSTSGTTDRRRYGFTQAQEDSIFDEIHGYLLMAGLQIGYGGALNADFSQASNFTLRLFELVRNYSPLAKNAGINAPKPIVNFAAWPLIQNYGPQEAAFFSQQSGDDSPAMATLACSPHPPETEVPQHDETGHPLFPYKTNVFALPDTPLRRFAWTRGLTRMRLHMTRETDARLVIGGALERFRGLIAGVVEEVWMSLMARRPLYLVGAFGGCARLVIDLLEGIPRTEICLPEYGPNAPTPDQVIQVARDRGLEVLDDLSSVGETTLDLERRLVTPRRVEADLIAAGNRGLANALCNGLDDAENRELFRSTDPTRIAALIMTGLSRLKFPNPKPNGV